MRWEKIVWPKGVQQRRVKVLSKDFNDSRVVAVLHEGGHVNALSGGINVGVLPLVGLQIKLRCRVEGLLKLVDVEVNGILHVHFHASPHENEHQQNGTKNFGHRAKDRPAPIDVVLARKSHQVSTRGPA